MDAERVSAWAVSTVVASRPDLCDEVRPRVLVPIRGVNAQLLHRSCSSTNGVDAQTRQGAPAKTRYRYMHACAQVARGELAGRGGPLMAIMALLRPGGTDQGLGGRFRWGQRVL